MTTRCHQVATRSHQMTTRCHQVATRLDPMVTRRLLIITLWQGSIKLRKQASQTTPQKRPRNPLTCSHPKMTYSTARSGSGRCAMITSHRRVQPNSWRSLFAPEKYSKAREGRPGMQLLRNGPWPSQFLQIPYLRTYCLENNALRIELNITYNVNSSVRLDFLSLKSLLRAVDQVCFLVVHVDMIIRPFNGSPVCRPMQQILTPSQCW